MEELAEEIVRCSEENRRKPDFDVNFYQNYETVRHRVICKLVNYRKNREMLSGMPHRRFHDLAVIYGYLLEDESFPDGVIFYPGGAQTKLGGSGGGAVSGGDGEYAAADAKRASRSPSPGAGPGRG